LLVSRQSVPTNAETTVDDLQSEITPDSSFYVRSHFPAPEIDPDKWRLEVEFASMKKRLALSDLMKMPQRTITATLECAGNSRSLFHRHVEGEVMWGEGAVGTATWSGVSLASILQDACGSEFGNARNWQVVVFEGADRLTLGTAVPEGKPDRFVRYLNIEKALDEDTIVATFMNGKPPSKDHGFPARLVVPGWYGMASVKWLSKITVLDTTPQTYFNDTKYVYKQNGKTLGAVSAVRVKSVITRPLDGQEIPLGETVAITGKAWSGPCEIVKVEVGDGEGSWSEAILETSQGKNAWRSWKKDWTPNRRGYFSVTSRATDSEGNSQPDQPMQNDYLYGYNATSKVSVKVA
jgi:DMSO/TMAO reductase YedYZ molybdopterin-dependent catalytic subunit